jgi:MoaA/NifB/PqqE/SkfB family radical SAM enzyme
MGRSTPQLVQDARMWASRRWVRSLAPPDWLSVNVTLRCNLSCVMCTTCYDAPELSLDELRRIVDEAADMGVRVFNPLGGEPLVRQDLEELLAHAAERGMFVTLTTNATLLRPERAARLARVRPERLHVNVSLDGPEEAHDRVRGRGSFARAMAGYRALREADAAAGNPVRTVRANVILHRGNVHGFEDFLAWLEAEGFSGVQQLTLFRDERDDGVGGMWFTPADLPALEALCERLAAAKEAGRGPARLLVNPPADLRRVPRYYREGLSPLEAPCWAGWKELYVNADGGVLMCDGKLDFLAGRFGSVREASLRELWRSPALAERREVVKACTTPCIQGCYLRRESDQAAPIAIGLARNVAAPVRARMRRALARVRPPRPLGATLVFEACAVPLDASDPRFAAALASAAGETPAARALAALRAGSVRTASGFGGEELLRKCIDDLDAAGIRVSAVHLGWRGEAGLHPDLPRLVVCARRGGRAVTVGVHATLAAHHGLAPSAVGGVPTGPCVVVTWDARVLFDVQDVRQVAVAGNAWEEDVAVVVARRSASPQGARGVGGVR